MGQGALEKEVLDLTILIYSVVVMAIIAITIIVFFIAFQKRKNQLLLDQLKQKQAFEEELANAQQEIQEATLKHVGRELHDNVGQLLSVATMQMNALSKAVHEDVKSKVDSASEALKESLAEVRNLSKSLNSDVIANLGFDATVKNEIARLNKSGLLTANLSIEGENINFKNKKDGIILFRILQEFFSNTLKYAEAEHLNVHLDYNPKALRIEVTDNGKGFDIDGVEQGSGMTNMKKRAELIDTEFYLESKPDKGTTLTLTYAYRDP
ncbi:sensor histidine kinase [Winogradskyella sp.]|uniref:sensor histidine kinase n=1 Tax=Winogradskyella sp. TaxID=1883156 RepID=UPI003BAC1BAC